MYSEKAINTLNVLISGGLEQGITDDLVKHLRVGHAQYIRQETWLLLADFLESGCKRPPHRPATGKSREIRNRDHTIRQEYRRLREAGETQKVAYGLLAEKYRCGEKSIHTINTHN